MERKLYENIWNTLSAFKQMIFIAGPRQAGKTTFARMLAEKYTNSLYFNWDIIEEKKRLLENPHFYEEVRRQDSSAPLIVFDELHKYDHWKNFLKSAYDRDNDKYVFIVSGSGRLDMYQKGGDSLAGRYLLLYLWPFSLAELSGHQVPFDAFVENPLMVPQYPGKAVETAWEQLARFSGFPDPYLQGSEHYYRLWSTAYRKQLLREDIRDLTALKSFDNVELLFSLLPSKIGSPLSMASLARDLRVSFDSIKKWLDIFESFFLVFRIAPWGKKISRAITKEKKVYLYDYAAVESPAVKFENMVAFELLRAVNNWNDLGLGSFSLHYVRNREKEEVDFLIAKQNKPFLLVEAKLNDDRVPKSLRKFQNQLNIPAVQLVNKSGICKQVSNGENTILIISAFRWLAGLP